MALCGAPQNEEFERDLISERTKAGLVSAGARGPKGGAPFQNDSRKSPPRDGRHGTKGNESDRFMQSEQPITRQTLYRHVAPNGTLRKDGLKVVEGGKIRSGKKK
jgi:DNA invertase Pin-like site-specific DNA recombinase